MSLSNGQAYELSIQYQPSMRPLNAPNRTGQPLTPHLIVKMTGPVSDSRYFAYAYSSSSTKTRLSGNCSTSEDERSKETGSHGSVAFEFGGLHCESVGTCGILVIVYEAGSSTHLEVARIETDLFEVVDA
jgi:hypothetical protein